MECQQQNLESMQTEEVEYLDYHRPKGGRSKGEYQKDPELQAIALRLHSIKHLQTQPPHPTPQDTQSQPLQKPPFSLSLTLTLQKYKIIAQLGTHLDFHLDAILLPYHTSQFQYRPCSQFRQELKTENQKIVALASEPGELYLRAKKFLGYRFRAFVKVDQETANGDMAYGLESLFKLIEENPKKIDISSIAILYTPQLSTLPAIYNLLLSLNPKSIANPLCIHLLLPTRSLLSQFYELTS